MKPLSHIWQRIQGTLFPFLQEHLDPLTEKQKQLITILELVRIEDFVRSKPLRTVGRPPCDRSAIARAFVLKSVYNLQTTEELIDRLRNEKNLLRVCGFACQQEVPNASTFSRAFDEFAQIQLPTRVHAALIQDHQSARLIGHICRDSTKLEAREKPSKKPKRQKVKHNHAKRCRGRPRKGEIREEKPLPFLARQAKLPLPEMLKQLPTACDRGCKKNSQGYTESWNGYKLHIDTADGDIPISCLLTSASVHDSQVALPLAMMTAQRVQSLYDVMDAAYDAEIINKHSRSLGHVPIIGHNPRRGEKIEMDKATAERYKVRSSSERVNARGKDEFGLRHVRVRGAGKVMAHAMFGILALTADQLFRLLN